jgi:MFS family permease
LAYSILQQLVDALQVTEFETLVVLCVNVTCIAATAIIGSFLADKFSRRENILSLWMFGGIFVSLITFFCVPSTFIDLMIISAVFGGYFGFGMPAVMGYFSRSTSCENRARLSGIIFLVISFGFFLISYLVVSDITLASVVLALFQIVSLSLFFYFKANIITSREARNASYLGVLSSRPLLLFLVPWFIFNIVNYMTIPVISSLSEGYELMQSFSILENIIIAISALVTGLLADSMGRKRLAIFGFAILGVGYAALGFLQGSLGWYIHTVADGVAWGILYVLFLFTLWGDLAQGQKSEKFYVIGSLPFLFSNFMTRLLTPLILISGIQPVALFSLASFFLFLAVLPLFYAPETLPEKVIKDKDLKSYVEKAKQKVQKEAAKNQKKAADKTEDDSAEDGAEPEESKEDEEARKLAEKYY